MKTSQFDINVVNTLKEPSQLTIAVDAEPQRIDHATRVKSIVLLPFDQMYHTNLPPGSIPLGYIPDTSPEVQSVPIPRWPSAWTASEDQNKVDLINLNRYLL